MLIICDSRIDDAPKEAALVGGLFSNCARDARFRPKQTIFACAPSMFPLLKGSDLVVPDARTGLMSTIASHVNLKFAT